MSTAELDIWISEPGEPCRITDMTYEVSIAHCNGEVLDWCDQEYVGLQAECGHLEVEVPPGCYHIRAAHHGTRFVGGGLYKANWLTDSAIVEVSCGDTKCVRLYSPTARICDLLFTLALQQFGNQMGADDELLNETIQNLEALGDQLPETAATSRRVQQIERLTQLAMEKTEEDEPQGENEPREKDDQ